MNSIGEKIRELLRAKDMTQEELALSLGVAYQTVSKWETGVTSPDLGLIVPIARLFRVTTDELFDYSENADQLRMDELEKLYENTTPCAELILGAARVFVSALGLELRCFHQTSQRHRSCADASLLPERGLSVLFTLASCTLFKKAADADTGWEKGRCRGLSS